MNDTQHLKREKEIEGKSRRTRETREEKTNYPVSKICKKKNRTSAEKDRKSIQM